MKLHKILILVSSLSVLLFIGYSAVKSQHVTHGFASHYTFSRLLLTEGETINAYDTAYFNLKIKEYGFNNIRDIPNLPTSAFTLIPIAWMEPVTAKIVWTIISLISLFMSINILFYAFEIPYKSNLGLLLILVTFLFYPLYYNTSLGQSYAVMLLLFSTAIYGLKKNNHWLVSVPLSFLFLYKCYGLFPLFALLLSKRYKEFFAAVFITAAIILITLPITHLNSWQMYYINIFSKLGLSIDSSNTAYQTLISFMGHLLVYDEIKNPYALMNVPRVFVYFSVQLLGAVFLFITALISERKDIIILFCTSICMNVIFAPIAEDYNTLLYLPCIYLAGKYIYKNYKSRKPLLPLFILSVVLLGAPFNFRGLQPAGFPVYLLAYPRLYGAILLILFMITLLKGYNISENLQEK